MLNSKDVEGTIKVAIVGFERFSDNTRKERSVTEHNSIPCTEE
jgi:hypothetical protein